MRAARAVPAACLLGFGSALVAAWINVAALAPPASSGRLRYDRTVLIGDACLAPAYEGQNCGRGLKSRGDLPGASAALLPADDILPLPYQLAPLLRDETLSLAAGRIYVGR